MVAPAFKRPLPLLPAKAGQLATCEQHIPLIPAEAGIQGNK
jgi:hypothetical protein